MATTIAAPPLQTPLVESIKDLTITKVWGTWLRALVDRAQVAAYAVQRVSLTAQTASIASSDLVPLASGIYRVSYRFRISTADAVSSSLQVTVTTTEGGASCSYIGTAYTGNVTNRPQAGSVIVHADPSSPVSYSTTYASNTPGAMAYEIDVFCESL